MECSNCLTKMDKKYITVCQQCLIDIEESKNYETAELVITKNKLNSCRQGKINLRDIIRRNNTLITNLRGQVKEVKDILRSLLSLCELEDEHGRLVIKENVKKLAREILDK